MALEILIMDNMQDRRSQHISLVASVEKFRGKTNDNVRWGSILYTTFDGEPLANSK